MTDDITACLDAWGRGERDALESAMPGLYDALREIALRRLRREPGAVTLDPTELVHEAMLRMLGPGKGYNNRVHFLAVAALYMRSILTDRAREIRAGRHVGAGMALTLDDRFPEEDRGVLDLLALDQALQRLEEEDARAARVLELTWFAGMTQEEVAEAMSLSLATVSRDLRFARAHVNRTLR